MGPDTRDEGVLDAARAALRPGVGVTGQWPACLGRTQRGGGGAPVSSPPAQRARPRQSLRNSHTSHTHTQSTLRLYSFCTIYVLYHDGCGQRREASSYSVSQRACRPRWPLRRVAPVGLVSQELGMKAVGRSPGLLSPTQDAAAGTWHQPEAFNCTRNSAVLAPGSGVRQARGQGGREWVHEAVGGTRGGGGGRVAGGGGSRQATQVRPSPRESSTAGDPRGRVVGGQNGAPATYSSVWHDEKENVQGVRG